MQNERFKNLVLIIFNQTFGILKYHNTDRERNGAFSEFFGSAHLGRDLKKISKGEPIDSSIYIAAINGFFNNPDCIEKTVLLMQRLESEKYITGLNGADILTKCDQHTIHIYRKILLNLWNFYYSQYPSNDDDNIKVYSISQNILDSIIQEFTRYRLPVSLDFYQQRIPDIIELLRIRDPNALYDSIESEYIYFFKNVLENNSFYTLSHNERVIFFNTLYAVSDILDKIHHKDSYDVNLEVMTFLNEIYNDNYTNISIDDICRVQGCIFAIAVESTDESLKGNIKLTPGNNITRIKTKYKSISRKTKLEKCKTALMTLLSNKNINAFDEKMNTGENIPNFEDRLIKSRKFDDNEIKNLFVLSLVYSTIAVCELQYIKNKIDIYSKYQEHVNNCEIYHKRAIYLRNLIVHINKIKYGVNSSNYINALHSLAIQYNAVATRYFYLKDYANCIAIRAVLYNFYTTLKIKDQARKQLDFAPITQYEQNGGNSQLYARKANFLFENCKKDFSYLFTKKMMSYDKFSKLVTEYQKYKNFF